jgi:hypothetical protein
MRIRTEYQFRLPEYAIFVRPIYLASTRPSIRYGYGSGRSSEFVTVGEG